MERLFFQLIKKKVTSLDKFPPLNYHKTLNLPPFFVSPNKISEKIRGEGGGGAGKGGRKLPFKSQPHKMVKHTQQPTNCFSMFDRFVGLAFKGLRNTSHCKGKMNCHHINVFQRKYILCAL